MKTRLLSLLSIGLATSTTLAADAAPPPSWRADTLGQALLYMLMFAAVGIIAAIAGYKLFDKFTPGDMHKEIVEKQNVAAAVVAAAVVLGVCIIIAAAMIG
jgi:putative membrane protein